MKSEIDSTGSTPVDTCRFGHVPGTPPSDTGEAMFISDPNTKPRSLLAAGQVILPLGVG